MLKELSDKINFFKEEYDIKKSSYRTKDKDSCRIAIIITEAYLEIYKDFNKALFLERELYEELKLEYLSCESINHENRSKELKHKDWNPLKITLSSREHETRSSFVEEIISLLTDNPEKGNEENGIENERRTRTRKNRRIDITRKSNGTIRSNKRSLIKLEIK